MPTARANKATPNNPFLGKTLGERYRIEKLIGRGGMGLVHLAKETKHGREVVIKMLAPHWADDKNAIARFEREGLRLAQLTHPNIVELFDIGHEDGQSYIVMEFIRGEPLRRFLGRHSGLSLAEFLPLAKQILAAVAYAHSRSMMLRDIKPSNIMLSQHAGKSHFVKMLDFGLAKLVDGDDVEITKAHVIGTAGYLAPEQIKGEECDVRVDVYALGILFFVMLVGKSPILGENDGAVLYNHVHGKPRELAKMLREDHDIPESLIALIHQCMEKDPDARPKDAAAVAEALAKCAEPELFELPDSTAERRAAIDEYWEAKFNPQAEEDEEEKPTSAEWTRPHLRKLLEAGGKDPAAGQNGPPQPPKAVKRKTKPPREKTRVGLPATAESPNGDGPPPARRPKPAKTAARARMDAPTQMMESRGRPVAGKDESAASTLTGAPRPRAAPPPRPRKPTAIPTARPMPKSMQAKPPKAPPKLPPPRKASPPPIHKPPVTRMPSVSAEGAKQVPASSSPLESGPAATLQQPVHEPKADPALLSQSLQVAPLASPAIPPPVEPTLEVEEPPQKRRPVAAVVVVSVVLASALGGMIAYLIFGDGSQPTPVATASASEAAAAPEAEPEAADEEEPEAAEPLALADAAKKPEPEPTLGTVPVSGPEGALLYVDGEKVGELPTDASLPPGMHTISIEADGYLPWETEVDVTAGANEEIVAELEAAGRGSSKVRVSRRGSRKDRGSVEPTPSPTPVPAPTKPKPTPRATPDPMSAGPGKPVPKAPDPKPTPKPKAKQDDVFMKPGSKGRTKDDGIFLPVGKGK